MTRDDAQLIQKLLGCLATEARPAGTRRAIEARKAACRLASRSALIVGAGKPGVVDEAKLREMWPLADQIEPPGSPADVDLTDDQAGDPFVNPDADTPAGE